MYFRKDSGPLRGKWGFVLVGSALYRYDQRSCLMPYWLIFCKNNLIRKTRHDLVQQILLIFGPLKDVYLASIMDLFFSKIIAWNLSELDASGIIRVFPNGKANQESRPSGSNLHTTAVVNIFCNLHQGNRTDAATFEERLSMWIMPA